MVPTDEQIAAFVAGMNKLTQAVNEFCDTWFPQIARWDGEPSDEQKALCGPAGDAMEVAINRLGDGPEDAEQYDVSKR